MGTGKKQGGGRKKSKEHNTGYNVIPPEEIGGSTGRPRDRFEREAAKYDQKNSRRKEKNPPTKRRRRNR